jgi:hypothetical protein
MKTIEIKEDVITWEQLAIIINDLELCSGEDRIILDHVRILDMPSKQAE